MSHTVKVDINGLGLSLETGKVAKQADGAVVVRYGGTMVLATCVAAKAAKES
jgi:polyribonucleotide nucleotidyltransferase